MAKLYQYCRMNVPYNHHLELDVLLQLLLIYFHEGIFEVQTGGFYPLRKKIEWYLSHTACHITVVHPLPAVRYLSWIDPTDGHIISRRKSPKRGEVKHMAKELYWLSAPVYGAGQTVGGKSLSVRISGIVDKDHLRN